MAMLKSLSTDRTHTVGNKLCPYCGITLLPPIRTRDHVLSRKFVPQGTLVDSCNIGLQACQKCNGHKSKLEDDISAITMLPNVLGEYARDDERLRKSSRRKAAGSVSAATKRKVEKSQTSLRVNAPFGNATATFGFTGHPVIQRERAALLAWMQIQGIYFFQTFDQSRGHGKFLPKEQFHMVELVSKADWGNSTIQAFANDMKAYEPVTHACLADGYFRATIRTLPDQATLAWAVEWNEAFRCFGYWGAPETCKLLADQLPEPKMEFVAGDTVNGFAYRTETPISDDMEDSLFDQPPSIAADAA